MIQIEGGLSKKGRSKWKELRALGGKGEGFGLFIFLFNTNPPYLGELKNCIGGFGGLR